MSDSTEAGQVLDLQETDLDTYVDRLQSIGLAEADDVVLHTNGDPPALEQAAEEPADTENPGDAERPPITERLDADEYPAVESQDTTEWAVWL